MPGAGGVHHDEDAIAPATDSFSPPSTSPASPATALAPPYSPRSTAARSEAVADRRAATVASVRGRARVGLQARSFLRERRCKEGGGSEAVAVGGGRGVVVDGGGGGAGCGEVTREGCDAGVGVGCEHVVEDVVVAGVVVLGGRGAAWREAAVGVASEELGLVDGEVAGVGVEELAEVEVRSTCLRGQCRRGRVRRQIVAFSSEEVEDVAEVVRVCGGRAARATEGSRKASEVRVASRSTVQKASNMRAAGDEVVEDAAGVSATRGPLSACLSAGRSSEAASPSDRHCRSGEHNITAGCRVESGSWVATDEDAVEEAAFEGAAVALAPSVPETAGVVLSSFSTATTMFSSSRRSSLALSSCRSSPSGMGLSVGGESLEGLMVAVVTDAV